MAYSGDDLSLCSEDSFYWGDDSMCEGWDYGLAPESTTPSEAESNLPGSVDLAAVEAPSMEVMVQVVAPPVAQVPGYSLIPNAPILGKRSNGNGSVAARFRAIIGDEIRQTELIALHQGLFSHVLPPLSRSEKRTKTYHLMTFEQHRVEVLDILDTEDGIARVVEAALASRANEREWRGVLSHIMNIGNK
jgi:hypothetical protein